MTGEQEEDLFRSISESGNPQGQNAFYRFCESISQGKSPQKHGLLQDLEPPACTSLSALSFPR